MRLLVACLALGLLPLPALAAYRHRHSVPPPLPTARPDDSRPTSVDGVSRQFDVSYATLPGPLTLDIYAPRKQPGGLPILVYVHGGSWKNGDSRHSLSFADFPRALAGLAAQGYVVASVNYRLSPQAHFPAALQDVKAAIRWLRVHAPDIGGDPTRVAVWGAAAGGQLAAMVGTTCGVTRFAPDGDTGRNATSDCVDAVIDWYGPSDLGSPASKPAEGGSDEGAYLGCEPAACAPGVVRLASPLTFVSLNAPPFLIQHGAADSEVPPRQAQQLYDALKQNGVPAELEIYPGVGHGFVIGNAPDDNTVTTAMAKLTTFLAAVFPARHKP